MVVGLRRIDGTCSTNVPTLGSIGLRVSSKRFIFMYKSDKSNGSALVGLLLGRLSPASKAVAISKEGLTHVHRGRIPGCEEGIKIIFRSFELLGSEGICRGMTFTLGIVNTSATIVGGGIPRVLSVMKLTTGCGSGPERLSKKRRREMTVTETLIGRPDVLLTSRPANGLSGGGT